MGLPKPNGNGRINVSWQWVAGGAVALCILLLQTLNAAQARNVSLQIAQLNDDLERIEASLNADLEDLEDTPRHVLLLESRVDANEQGVQENLDRINTILDILLPGNE